MGSVVFTPRKETTCKLVFRTLNYDIIQVLLRLWNPTRTCTTCLQLLHLFVPVTPFTFTTCLYLLHLWHLCTTWLYLPHLLIYGPLLLQLNPPFFPPPQIYHHPQKHLRHCSSSNSLHVHLSECDFLLWAAVYSDPPCLQQEGQERRFYHIDRVMDFLCRV